MQKCLKFLGLIVSVVYLFCFTSCTNNSIEGTYYEYKYGELDKTSYFIFENDKWKDDYGIEGEYKIDGSNITLFTVIFDSVEELCSGIIGNGKFEYELLGSTYTYYKEGFEPTKSDASIAYTITFDNQGFGVTPKCVNNVTKIPSSLPELTANGYTFEGWYLDQEFTKEATPGTTIMSNITLYAKWTKGEEAVTKYTVTFDANGGTFGTNALEKADYNENESIVSPTSPIKQGSSFVGWTINKSTNELFDFSTAKATQDLILYAVWSNDSASILSVEGAKINDKDIYMLVDNNIDDISLSKKVVCSDGATWKLYYDKLGQIEIPTKIAASQYGCLTNGDNIFYIVVTSSDNLQVNVYKLNIYKSFEVSINYYDGEELLFIDKADTGYEYKFDYLPNLVGYTFNYWKTIDGDKIINVDLRTNYNVYCDKSVNKYTIKLDPNGGNVLSNTIEVKYNESYHLPVPTRKYYTFEGWYDGSLKMTDNFGNSIGNYLDVSNKTFIAKWTLTSYNITYNLNGGTNNYLNPSTYTVEDDIMLKTPIKDGYTFIGWTNDDIPTPTINISISESTGNLNFTANWCKMDLVRNNVNAGSITTLSDTYFPGDEVTIIATTKPGYTFIGWYEGETLLTNELNYTFEIPSIDKTYEARWIKVSIISGNKTAGSVTTLSDTYFPGDEVTIIATTTKTGYRFIGWYEGETLLTNELSYTFEMPSVDRTYEAIFTNKYIVTLDADGGTYTGEDTYEVTYGSDFSLPTVKKQGYKFIGWKYEDKYITDQNGEKINEITVDCILKATFIYFNQVDSKTLYFGSYPQTKITDSSLTTSLDQIAGTLPTSSNTQSWEDYGYYMAGNVESYMYYIDIDYDNDGSNDYRGVYFSSYRPDSTVSSTIGQQPFNGYSKNTVYWFKYEPIKWIILKTNGNKSLILSELIIDAQNFYNHNNSTTINGKTIYSNNYMYSYIRSWLNDTFYNTAFNTFEKEFIETTSVDNSVSSTTYSSNKYACSNTNDKIFLLSCKEATTYASDELKANNSDYALVQGNWSSTDGGGYWWTRSPDGNLSNRATLVHVAGRIELSTMDSSGLTTTGPCNEYVSHIEGVRVSCWINL